MPASNLPRWETLLWGTALACLVGVVFFPIVGFEFVDLDVEGLVVRNPSIRAFTLENLKQIFTVPMGNKSYYPVRSLSFALDYQIWGLNPGGFKLTNGLIHLANVLLVFWLALRILARAPEVDCTGDPRQMLQAAALSAGFFAVHPVVVEPVAWVAGREELLMALGALGCMHCYMSGRRVEENPGKSRWAVGWYACATMFFAAACLSNRKAVIIPLILVTWDVLTLRKPTAWRILKPTAALWVIGFVTNELQQFGMSYEKAGEASALSLDRLALILSVYWQNVRFLLWPTNLAIYSYEEVPGSLLQKSVILGGIALGLTLLAFWKLRRRKLMLFGLLWFAVALAPTSQIMAHSTHRADRFLYLPLAGLAVTFAIGLVWLRNASKRPGAPVLAAICVLLLIALSVTSAAQVQTWQSSVSMWENTVNVQPDHAQARCALADALTRDGQFQPAKGHYEEAIRLSPRSSEFTGKFAVMLTICEEPLQDFDRAVRLAQRASDLNPEHAITLSLVYSRYAQALASRGEFGRAVELYNRALGVMANNPVALIGLAQVLIGSADQKWRNPQEAVRLAEFACGPAAMDPGPEELDVLAAAYAAAGRFDAAVAATQRAIKAATAADEVQRTAQLQHRLKIYRKRAIQMEAP